MPPKKAVSKASAEPKTPAKRSLKDEKASPPPAAKARKVGPAGASKKVQEEDDLLERAAVSMQPHSFEGRLPCREEENEGICEHLQMAVKQGGSTQVLFLSGMPGTGKTASVLETVRQLQGAKATPHFIFAHVNAMRLGQPGAIYSDLHNQLRDKGVKSLAQRCAAAAAQHKLTTFFSERSSREPVVVLLVDEVDQLVTRNQAVLYRVFDWLTMPQARLAIIAVSNTMDLPERLLPRVASRFGIVRVNFAPYRLDQILQILNERLKGRDAVSAFAPTALKLCAGRVAAGSGDIRKALQLCRRALEVRIASAGDSGPAELAHLDVAMKELLRANPGARHISGLSSRMRRFLEALLLELRKQAADAAPLHKVVRRYEKLHRLTGGDAEDEDDDSLSSLLAGDLLQELSQDSAQDVQHLEQKLESMGLIKLMRRSVDITGSTVILGADLDTEDLSTALEAAEEDEGIRELLRESAQRHMGVE